MGGTADRTSKQQNDVELLVKQDGVDGFLRHPQLAFFREGVRVGGSRETAGEQQQAKKQHRRKQKKDDGFVACCGVVVVGGARALLGGGTGGGEAEKKNRATIVGVDRQKGGAAGAKESRKHGLDGLLRFLSKAPNSALLFANSKKPSRVRFYLTSTLVLVELEG